MQPCRKAVTLNPLALVLLLLLMLRWRSFRLSFGRQSPSSESNLSSSSVPQSVTQRSADTDAASTLVAKHDLLRRPVQRRQAALPVARTSVGPRHALNQPATESFDRLLPIDRPLRESLSPPAAVVAAAVSSPAAAATAAAAGDETARCARQQPHVVHSATMYEGHPSR